MTPPSLILQDIQLGFGGPPLLDGAELSVGEGERLCLVGRNGSGKSTLMKIAAGLIEPDRGTRFLQPGTTVRYLPQEPDLGGHETTLAYVEAGLAPGDDPHRARYLLQSLGLTGDEAPARLSGGEARRAGLARALAPSPDILLLDEPTNHLDIAAIEWLEAELKSSRSALVLISHDRRFLEALSSATIWLDRGRARRLERGFSAFEAWRDTILAEEETERHKLDRKIDAELDWVRYGVTARRKRNQGRLRALGELREKRRNARRAQGLVRMEASEGETSGKLVIEAVGISKSFGETNIVRDFSIRVGRGDRIGLVGPNGAGKTTLLNLLTGALTPDSGTIRLGANLEMVTLDQRRDSLDGETSLSDTLTGGGTMVRVGQSTRHVVSYMKDFLFLPEQARTPVSRLSGGERGRLMLARALATPSNLLVLDEPTNDLDLETLDLLQELIADYAGTVLVVSHDRDFLDRVATSLIVSEGEGRWTEYAGGYTDMLAQRKAAGQTMSAPDAPKPRKRASPAPERSVPAPVRTKLSFRDKHALETLPAAMSALEAERERLNETLADPNLYVRDPAAFADATERLAAIRAELDEAENRWLELELMREAAEGG